MLKKFCIYSFALFISASSILFPQFLKDKRQHESLLKGIHFTLQQEYDSAETVFRTMIREFPDHPSGYLYLAGMLQAKYTDYGNYFNEEQYDSLLDAVENLSEPLIQNTSTSAFGYFYSGSAEAFRAFTKSENGNVASGIYYGISAGGSLERCLEADPDFTEAKNILGSFYYWRSKLAWIPFVSDRSEEGIKLILESYDHPYEKHLASHNLMVIFTEEKRYADAEKYGLIMLREYPDNRLFLWNMMSVYEQWKKDKELRNIIEQLLKSTTEAKTTNRYTETVCRLKRAQFSITDGRIEDAKEDLNAVLTLKKYIGKTKGNIKKKINQAEELLDSLEKK